MATFYYYLSRLAEHEVASIYSEFTGTGTKLFLSTPNWKTLECLDTFERNDGLRTILGHIGISIGHPYGGEIIGYIRADKTDFEMRIALGNCRETGLFLTINSKKLN